MYNFFYSIISFIIALFFILIGIIGIMIPWSPNVRSEIIHFILDNTLAISLFGFAFILIGLGIVISILQNSRRSYYYVRSGQSAVLVDEAVIHQYLSVYWKQLFPDIDVPYKVNIKRNRISLSVDLPYKPLEEQRPLLERIKQDLSHLFSSQIGYNDEFSLTATFQKAPI